MVSAVDIWLRRGEDYCGVEPDRCKTDGAPDTLYDEGKAESEAFEIAHPGKQPASGE